MSGGVSAKLEGLVTPLEDELVHGIANHLKPLDVAKGVLRADQEGACTLVLNASVRLVCQPTSDSDQHFTFSIGILNLVEDVLAR